MPKLLVNWLFAYRFTNMTVTIVNCIVLDMVLRDVDNGEGILTLGLVFPLTWLGKTEDSI